MPTNAERKLLFERIGYEPTPAQWQIHLCLSRIRLVTGGERSGKSCLAGNELVSRFHEAGQEALFWLVAADYERTRAEFEYCYEGFRKLGVDPRATKRIDPGEILVPGVCRIVTKSAKDPRTLVMEAPDGIIGCEASQLDYETFLRLRGRIAEKRGWLLLTGTLESSLGWYPEAAKRWQFENTEDAKSFIMPTWSNTVIYPGGREDLEIKKLELASSKDWFNERFAGIAVQLGGVVFPEFRNALHVGVGGEYEFNPKDDVWLWLDPGYGHYYAVEVVQKRGEHIWTIDEIYERGLVTSEIITICQKRPWWPKVIGGVADIAATQHQAMPAVVEVWQKEARLSLTSRKVAINEGIERLKTFLKVDPITNQANIHINAKCKGLISELGGCPNPDTGQTAVYRWRTDREGAVVGDHPLDRNNDAVKATIYGLVDLMGFSPSQRGKWKVKLY